MSGDAVSTAGETADVERLLSAPALAQAAAIAAGEITSRELVEHTLRRIEARDREINALVLVDGERALAEAVAADEALRRGGPASPLHGVPTAIKDIVPTRGMRTTFGSRAFADVVPDADAGSVARVRAAGMVILGKTNTPEFATSSLTDSELLGPCRNPWDPRRNAGGSSGGAAAVVAAGMLALAPGTDAAGSVRVPAAWCGIWGLKTSRGRVSLGPNAGERVGGLATEGPMGRTVTDVAALLDVEAGYAWGDPYWAAPPEGSFRELAGASPGRLRVRVVTDAPGDGPVDPAYRTAVAHVAGLLADAGHEVAEGPFAWAGDAAEPAAAALWATISGYYGDPDEALLTPLNAYLARRGRALTAFEYIDFKLEIERAARRIVTQWADFDVLLTPAAPLLAPPNDFLAYAEPPEQLERVMRSLSFARQFNFTGQPGLSVPTGLSWSGLPVGVQLVGPPAGEVLLLQLGRQLEDALPWQSAWSRGMQAGYGER